jgi:hypothetical protein
MQPATPMPALPPAGNPLNAGPSSWTDAGPPRTPIEEFQLSMEAFPQTRIARHPTRGLTMHTTDNTTARRQPRYFADAQSKRGNRPAHNLALVALAVLRTALKELADTIEPGPCTCESDPDRVCMGCHDGDVRYDAGGQLYTIENFDCMLDCNNIREPDAVSKLRDRLRELRDGEEYHAVDAERLAQVLLTMLDEDAGGNDGADMEADEPTAVMASSGSR